MSAAASPVIKVKKQSLIDWEVTDAAGKHVAWLRRSRDGLGYDVILRNFPGPDLTYFEPSFVAAKECARHWLSLD